MMTSVSRESHSSGQLPLFDCHVHIGPSDTGEIYYPELTANEYEALMAVSGIERACVFAPLRWDGYRQANSALAQWAAASRGRILAFARLGGARLPVTEPHLWLVRRKLVSLARRRRSDLGDLDALSRFSGVKMLPHMDGVVSAAELSRIGELRLPVLVHGGTYSSPRWIERNLVRHLKGPVIIAHLGAFPCDERLLRDAVEVARRNDNVYLDTSGAWLAEFIRFAAQRVPEKLLFGSDAPLMHPGVAWRHVATALRDDALLERIGWQTAKDIFG